MMLETLIELKIDWNDVGDSHWIEDRLVNRVDNRERRGDTRERERGEGGRD
jgi:hypothetical protein